MRLPIKKKYFDLIKSGEKNIEWRDAHITFVCEETGETLRKEVTSAQVRPRPIDFYPDVLEDEWTIAFTLKEDEPKQEKTNR